MSDKNELQIPTMNDDDNTGRAGSPRAVPQKAASPVAGSQKAASPRAESLKAASPKAASPKAASPKAASPVNAAQNQTSPKAASPKAASVMAEVDQQPEQQAEAEPEAEPEVVEKEVDEVPVAGSTRRTKLFKDQICWNPADSTIDTVIGQNGHMVSSLMGNGFQHLFSGVRATHGVSSGRVVLEVRIADIIATRKENEKYAAKIPSLQPKTSLRFGFGTPNASLVLGSDVNSIGFTDEGFWIHDRKMAWGGCKNDKTNVYRNFRTRAGDTFAFILNRDSSSELNNTISIFRNGVRFSDPRPIPEELQGEALFPMVSTKNISVYTNFGNAGFGSDGHTNMLSSLPFTVKLMQHMPFESLVASSIAADGKPQGKGGKYDVVIPVGIPDEGTFDYVDQFLATNNNKNLYVEVSDRALMQWCEDSQLHARGNDYRSSADRPEFRTGSPNIDDGFVKDSIRSMLPLIKRNVIVVEICNNLLESGRAEILRNFPESRFVRRCLVAIGEPPADFKDCQLKLAIQDWKVANPPKPEAVQPNQDTAQKCNEGGDMNDKVENDSQEKTKEEEVEEEKEPEPVPNMDANNGWFRVRPVCDVFSQTLMESLDKFSLPADEEGLDKIEFMWSGREKCEERLEEFFRYWKLNSKPNLTEPGEDFKPQLELWMREKLGWRKAHREYSSKSIAKLTENGEKTEDKDKETEEGDMAEEVDIDAIQNIDDVDGSGKPLYCNFKQEDWSLINLRFEIFMIVKQWEIDVTTNDPVRIGIIPRLLPWAYSVYFKRTLDAKTFGPNRTTTEEILALIEDTIKVNDQGVLESLIPYDAKSEEFVKLTEKARREREAKLAAGDESVRVEIRQSQVQNVGKGKGKGIAYDNKAYGGGGYNRMWQANKGGYGVKGYGAKGKGYAAPPQAYTGYKRPMDHQQVHYPYQRPRW